MKPGKIGEALKEETKQEGMFKLGKMIIVKYISRDEYYKVKPTYYDSLEEYQKEHDKTSIVDCFYQGKKIKYYQRYGKEKKPSFVFSRPMREPSIRKKFPNQFNNRTKNIDFSEEIDKMLIQDYSSRKNNESSSIFLPKGK